MQPVDTASDSPITWLTATSGRLGLIILAGELTEAVVETIRRLGPATVLVVPESEAARRHTELACLFQLASHLVLPGSIYVVDHDNVHDDLEATTFGEARQAARHVPLSRVREMLKEMGALETIQ